MLYADGPVDLQPVLTKAPAGSKMYSMNGCNFKGIVQLPHREMKQRARA